MHLHIIGVCGTFMGGIAAIARAAGHRVTGSDRNVYPPMSTQLAALGIDVIEGYEPDQLELEPGRVRGRQRDEPRQPAGRSAARQRRVATNPGPNGWRATCCSGTAGCSASPARTARPRPASLLAWILEHAGLEPGFLVGGVPLDFDVSARLGAGRHFVVEADEYDTAFFDKRAKFVHYRPRTAILNNLEHDHADIYPDVASIQRQFHLLLRTVPGNGRIVIVNARGPATWSEVLGMGCWTPVERFTAAGTAAAEWRIDADAGVSLRELLVCAIASAASGDVEWDLLGRHNAENALAALAAAHHAGVDAAGRDSRRCSRFGGVRRRLEVRGTVARRRRVRRLRTSPDGDRDARSRAFAARRARGA